MRQRLGCLVLFGLICNIVTCPMVSAQIEDYVRTVIYDGADDPGGLAIGNAYPPPKPAVSYIYCADMDGDLVAFSLRPNGSWLKEILVVGAAYEGVTIGPGRNDGIDRLYCIKDKQLWEVSYSGGVWAPSLMSELANTQWDYVVVGAAQEDGANRVYATDKFRNIHEFTYAGGAWQTPEVISTGMSCEAIGPGRNDGKNRIYGVGDPDGWTICELSHVGGSWVRDVIHSWDWAEDPIPTSLSSVFLAPARGDGIMRVYFQDMYRGINELSWNGLRFEHRSVALNYPTESYYGFGLQQWGSSFAYGKLWKTTQPVLDKRLWICGRPSDASPTLEPDVFYVLGFAWNGVTQTWSSGSIGYVGKGGLDIAVGALRATGDTSLVAVSLDGVLVEFHCKK